MSDAPDESGDAAPHDLDPMASVEAWKAHAAGRVDPVALAVLEGLSRRATQQHGEARRVMVERVEVLLARWTQSPPVDVPRACGASSSNATSPKEHHERRDALAGLSALVDRLGRSSTSPAPAPAAAPRTAGARSSAGRGAASVAPSDRSKPAALPPRLHAASPKPLKSVAAFKGIWSRLRAEQRLRQVLAQVPAMAGPLNSAHVVNRALQAMRELSPQYLDAFILHIDTLLWLEQSSGGGEPLHRAPAPGEAAQRPTRKG